MEHQPLKSPVGKKNTQIWEAYQEVLEELRAKESVPDTTAVAKAERLAHAVETAEKIEVDPVVASVETMVEGLLRAKDTFDELKTAIDAKKEELERVHRIEAEANSLAALIAIKDGLVSERTERAAAILQDAKDEAEKILLEAKESMDTLRKEFDLQLAEDARQQRRRTEEWEYSFERKRREQLDSVQDEIDAKLKALAAREEEVSEREALADKLLAEVDDLKDRLEAAEEKTLARIAAAVEEAKDKAEKSAQIQKSFAEKQLKAEIGVLMTKNENLQELVGDLRQRLDRAENQVQAANDRVSTMATNALKAGADAATVARVSEIAAGAGSKK